MDADHFVFAHSMGLADPRELIARQRGAYLAAVAMISALASGEARRVVVPVALRAE